MTAGELIEKIWEHVGPALFISRSDFIDSLAGWEITPRQIDGELAGATLRRGPEFHFVTFGKRKVFPASLIEECLGPILDQHGVVITRTPKDDVRQQRFNQLIGFSVYSTDEYFTYFRLEQLNLHGRKSCQS